MSIADGVFIGATTGIGAGLGAGLANLYNARKDHRTAAINARTAEILRATSDLNASTALALGVATLPALGFDPEAGERG